MVLPTVDIDGIATHYEISGSGPPILMMAPGGFDSATAKRSTTWPWQHFLPLQVFARDFTCMAYDRREAGQSALAPQRLAGIVLEPEEPPVVYDQGGPLRLFIRQGAGRTCYGARTAR
jgi:hypothetical protein